MKIKIHPNFKLNGRSYAEDELKALAYDLVKEGLPHEQEIGNFLADWLDENNTITVKTSGSTGTPKTITLQKEYMVNSALATGEYFHLKEKMSALLCLPAAYIAGKMMLVRALVLGLELDYVAPISNPLEKVSKIYDFAAMVPMQLKHSLDVVDCIRTLIVGGAPVSIALKDQVQEKQTAIFETYGMTETITHIAVKRINKDGSSTANISSNQEYFQALPSVRFATDARGCLVINALNVSKEAIKTNDLVNLESETEFEWLGRYDNVINSGGIKLHPEQIEAKLAPSISQRFFVAGISNEKLGQKLVLLVEGKVNTSALLKTVANLGSLKKFETPKEIYALPQFVETNTGKINRNENLRLI